MENAAVFSPLKDAWEEESDRWGFAVHVSGMELQKYGGWVDGWG